MQQDTVSSYPEQKKGIGRKIFFGILFLLIILFLLVFLGKGFSWRFFSFFIFWTVALFMTFQFAFKKKYSLGIILLVVIFGFLFSFFIYPSSSPKTISGNEKNTNGAVASKQNTDSSTKSVDFTKKVLKISSANGDATGTVSVDKKSGGTYYAIYNFLVKANVPFNSKCGPAGTISRQMCAGTRYEYSGRLVRPDKPADKRGVGVVSAVYCNKDQAVPDPYSTSNRTYTMETCGIKDVEGLKTDTFYATFSANFDSYDAFLQATTFEMYDFSNFWEDGKQPNSYVGNTDRPISESSSVKTFTLIISE
ncbi:MAG: hypothetical protein WCO05_03240 [Candidatus Moraniibacteriota bacterium]